VHNDPFSRRRVGRDLVNALPAIGMIVGAVAGGVLGLVNPDGSAVQFAGVGIVAGLLVGAFLRVVFRGP
jgi:outer membrane lipoprotein SlyB